ncbi:phage holin family protein [Demequina sp. SYSU T00192]|uniref:Phage holin family protein n=1 Tax=Demequina litoralis TaxID=3051660 RepID=A0ABT8G9N3_9MICO|nr:phage holin family protein [Demequina sp. SYSU T00192]MDN4475846.1 phage holin family protein [Demequina sp. SYSU T00192]
MERFLLKAAVFLASAVAALALTSLLLGDDFQLKISGLITATVIFALAQSLLSPLIERQIEKRARAVVGGVGIISTFVALLITATLTSGLSIHGFGAWAGGTLLVWLITAIGVWVLPGIFDRMGDKGDKGKAVDKQTGSTD